MHHDSLCSWSIGHCGSFVGVLVSVFLSVTCVFPECVESLEAVSPPIPPFLSTVLSVGRVCVLFSPSAWGLMAGLPGFASHGSSLHLGAGLAHDVGAQLRNKNGLTLDFLLFLVILKCSGRKTSQN